MNLSVWFALRTLFGSVHHHELGPLRFDSPEWSTLQPVALTLTIAALIAMLRFKMALGWILVLSGLCGITHGLLS